MPYLIAQLNQVFTFLQGSSTGLNLWQLYLAAVFGSCKELSSKKSLVQMPELV